MFLQNYITYTQDRGIGRQNDVIQQIVAETNGIVIITHREKKKITGRYREAESLATETPGFPLTFPPNRGVKT